MVAAPLVCTRGTPKAVAGAVSRPNIVIVIADDVTPSYHGCYGGPTPTPAIDRLAREGAIFHRACGVAPLCNPSRFTIFTGMYPGRAPSASAGCSPGDPYSIQQNADVTPAMAALPRLLRAGGYFTGHVGKWHSNFTHAGAKEWPEHLGRGADPDDRAVDAALRDLQETHKRTVRECAGFEWVQAVHWGNVGAANKPDALGHHNPAWKTDAALEFLEEAARDGRPFYLHLANTVPHGPDVNLSLGADHRYTPAGKLGAPPHSHPPDETVPRRLRAAGLQTEGPIAGINTGMVMIDDQIGALLGKLEAMGAVQNTIFLYTADHGIFGKGTCYLGGFRLPLVVRWPAGIQAGQSVDAPVSFVDFLPTLCEAAGVAVPGPDRIDGVSFLDGLTGRGPWRREAAYQEMGVSRGLLKGSWHYVAFRYPASVIARMEAGEMEMPPDVSGYGESPFGDLNFRYKPSYFEPEQLYNISEDPDERRNLADDPACAGVLEAMRRELWAVTARLPGPFPREAPAFMRSARFHEMVERRRARLPSIPYYPQGHDAEAVYNRNQRDPLAAG